MFREIISIPKINVFLQVVETSVTAKEEVQLMDLQVSSKVLAF